MSLVQYKKLPAINLDHVRKIDLFGGMYSDGSAARGIRFEFGNEDETYWMFKDQTEVIEVYEKLQAKFIHHV